MPRPQGKGPFPSQANEGPLCFETRSKGIDTREIESEKVAGSDSDTSERQTIYRQDLPHLPRRFTLDQRFLCRRRDKDYHESPCFAYLVIFMCDNVYGLYDNAVKHESLHRR